MAEIDRKTFTVTPTGVGRKDYSQDIQVSVEPQIRSYQQKYNSGVIELSMAAGGSDQQVIMFDTGYIYMVYDFYLSVPSNSLIRLVVEMYDVNEVYSAIVNKYGYANVATNYTKGFPMARRYRITGYNYGRDDLIGYFSAHGLRMLETEYYGLAARDVADYPWVI